MYQIGRICLKIAGRDAGKKCVVTEVVDDSFVMIDGATRRRKCNKKHLEPLTEVVDLKEKATHEEVEKALVALNIKVITTKPKKAAQRAVKSHIKRDKKPKKKAAKKEVKTEKKVETKAEEKPKEEIKAETKKE